MDLLDTFFEWFLGFNLWLDSLKLIPLSQIISTAATVAIAFFAWIGLQTWEKQTHTQKKLQFVDDLNDAVNEYILAMNIPIEFVSNFEIGIKYYTEAEVSRGDTNENAGFIKYIEKNGKEQGKWLFETLEKARPLSSRIHSLIIKGQILNFNDYNKTFQHCKMLMWSHDLISGFAMLLSSTSLNWENDLVQANLNSYREIRSSEISENLATHQIKVLKFCQRIYKEQLKLDGILLK